MITAINTFILRRKTLLLAAFLLIMSPLIIGKLRDVTYYAGHYQTSFEKQTELTNLAIKFFGVDETYLLTVRCTDLQFCDQSLNQSQRESIFQRQFFLSREYFDMSPEEKKSFKEFR